MKTAQRGLLSKVFAQYLEPVICNDSGLYFQELALDDPRQPGLNIRTPMGMNRLSDEEVTAYYLNGISVCHHGKISSFMDPGAARTTGAFRKIGQASPRRFPGWPLDSLSMDAETGICFTDGSVADSKENIIKGQYEQSILRFLTQSLQLESCKNTLPTNRTPHQGGQP